MTAVFMVLHALESRWSVKIGDLIRTRSNNTLGIIIDTFAVPGETIFQVELNRSFGGRSRWTFKDQELELINEAIRVSPLKT